MPSSHSYFLASDSSSRIFLLSPSEVNFRIYSSSGVLIATVALGTYAYNPPLNNAVAIFIDSSDFIYISNFQNIYKLNPTSPSTASFPPQTPASSSSTPFVTYCIPAPSQPAASFSTASPLAAC